MLNRGIAASKLTVRLQQALGELTDLTEANQAGYSNEEFELRSKLLLGLYQEFEAAGVRPGYDFSAQAWILIEDKEWRVS